MKLSSVVAMDVTASTLSLTSSEKAMQNKEKRKIKQIETKAFMMNRYGRKKKKEKEEYGEK